MSLPSAALASEITLQSTDGTLKFVGEFIDFQDDHYIIKTNLGNISIGSAGVTCAGDACPDLAAAEAQPAAQPAAPAEFVSGPVTLQSFDGALKFEGELIAITDGNYIVRTQLGDLQIQTNSVTCEGEPCPKVDVASLEPAQEEELKPRDVDDIRVTLTSFDGDLKFVGDLVDITNGKYVIRTNLGELRVSASTVSCEGPACPAVGGEILETAQADDSAPIEINYTISGSELIGENMMPLLMSGYAASKNAAVKMTDQPEQGGAVASLIGDNGNGDNLGSYLVASTSTEQAFQALLAGEAQIAMASRRIRPYEVQLLQNAGAGDIDGADQERVIALDNLVIVTHPDNAIAQISTEDLKGIYSGLITNWSQLGGSDAPINVLTMAPETASRSFFEERIFDGKGAGKNNRQTVVESDADMAAQVQADPNAIGYVGYAFQTGTKPVTLVNACGIPSVPDAFSAKTEEYLLSRRLYLYNRADNLDAEAAQFLEYAVSENADAMIAKSGFINLDVARRTQSETDARAVSLENTKAGTRAEQNAISEMLAEMAQHDRLSTTFRFRMGSSRMDEKARDELPRLVQYLKDLPEGTEVTLVGFTDSVGLFNKNQSLSISRASQVLNEINTAAEGSLNGLNFKVMGFGPLAPSTCNDTDDGRALNRRVEIWIRKGQASG
ncbi:phosphate ABC transporter substrate-binding/OmpA family protein [Actibacterium sp. XHP0104]|uniref:phosphate ABC transporter substrate-binding/OmpA family protein n=1 Tax=Actibacterium sp. XHP0104 TaxID=2984335 RepID=UPI0021E726AC|nr:phosphate ABC transporter substrate-binding/OmpA family protein [Actibacterium sp. XHP0104]MCV2880418.1 phosphate ABC transporter substrate-binding/OmpA family protein [Actibacterium sp. XHP0104]